MINECEGDDGMKVGRGDRSTPKNSAPAPLCLQNIPHDPTWDRAWAAAI
jgi:hypothetical protein